MESKSYQKFRSKIEYINQHVQLLDASLKTVSTTLVNLKNDNLAINTALKLKSATYPKLSQPIRDKDRVLSYSRSKNAEYTILELYSAFTVFMRNITDEMFKKNPMKIVGKVAENSSLSYADIIKIGSMESIGERMVNEIFRKFENERSTIKLIDKILSHTSVKVPDSLKEMALMYLEMRHLFIHAKGKADEKFINKYSEHIGLKQDGKLPTNFQTVSSAIDTVQRFAKAIDEQLIAQKVIDLIKIPTPKAKS